MSDDITCVSVYGWLPHPDRVEVTLHYLANGRRAIARRLLPAGTLKTQHEQDKVALRFKQIAREGYSHVYVEEPVRFKTNRLFNGAGSKADSRKSQRRHYSA